MELPPDLGGEVIVWVHLDLVDTWRGRVFGQWGVLEVVQRVEVNGRYLFNVLDDGFWLDVSHM